MHVCGNKFRQVVAHLANEICDLTWVRSFRSMVFFFFFFPLSFIYFFFMYLEEWHVIFGGFQDQGSRHLSASLYFSCTEQVQVKAEEESHFVAHCHFVTISVFLAS